MEEKLKLTDYLLLCNELDNNPIEENQKKIDDFLNQLQIKEYLPLKDKEVCLMGILTMLRSDFDAVGMSGYVEIGKICKGLLSYCINLENDLGEIGNTFLVYDNIMIHGLYNTIISICFEDYDMLTHMIDNAINLSNISQFLQTAELFNNHSYEDWIQTMQDFKSTFTPEIIQDLISINQQNDPNSLKTISDNLAKEAIAVAKKEEKEFAQKTAQITDNLSK